MQILKPITDRLNRGTCPIVTDKAGNRYRIDAVQRHQRTVRMYDLGRMVAISFPLVEFCNRLADGRIGIEE